MCRSTSWNRAAAETTIFTKKKMDGNGKNVAESIRKLYRFVMFNKMNCFGDRGRVYFVFLGRHPGTNMAMDG